MDFLVKKLLSKCKIFSLFCLLAFTTDCFSAASQFLDGINYPNPAAMMQVKKFDFAVSPTYINIKLNFEGSAPGGTGNAVSRSDNVVPTGHIAYRLNDRFVVGLYLTNAIYADIRWPLDSIVSTVSTETIDRKFGVSPMVSYQLGRKLTLGFGVNLIRTWDAELNFFVPGAGDLINKSSSVDVTEVGGLYYVLDPKTFLEAVYYSGVKPLAKGLSHLGNQVRANHTNLGNVPAVAYLGVTRFLTPKWIILGRLYWSEWSIFSQVELRNTVQGNFTIPTRWHDAWTISLSTRYALSKSFALLAGALYDTNVAPISTNSIGYPITGDMLLTAGLDIQLNKANSLQLVYGHGFFTRNSTIRNNQGVTGYVDLDANVVMVQLSIKA